jgi:hypothetical protein
MVAGERAAPPAAAPHRRVTGIPAPWTPDPGLCGRCRHARRTGNRRGSLFFLCALAAVDARFPKYPRLPVVRCAGFAPGGGAEEAPQ